ncbi:MAG: hypothetical protein ING28_03385 [Roseomonas sp.]|nr:hypothetical protein [Roseomonas sp.]
MPFIRRNISPIGGQSTPIVNGSAETVPGSPGIWSYRTADADTVVDTSGYFNDMAATLKQGDLIYRLTIDGSGALVSAGFHVVRSVTAAGVVDVTNVLALTITNTD